MKKSEAAQNYADGMWEHERARQIEIDAERFENCPAEQIADYRAKLLRDAEELVETLHTSAGLQIASDHGRFHPSNRLSRRLFSNLFGVQLPATVSGTREAIRQYVGAETWDRMEREEAEGIRASEERLTAEKQQAADDEDFAEFERIAPLIRADKQISGNDLVFMARHLNVEIHPRTVGTLRRYIVAVNSCSSKVHKGHRGGKAYAVYEACQRTLTETVEA